MRSQQHRGRTGPAVVAVIAVATALVLAACSSAGSTSSSSKRAAEATATAAAAETSGPAPSASVKFTVGVELPAQWATTSLVESGDGYGMRLTSTSDPDLFDGHFFRQKSNGAITDQQVITILVTSRTDLAVSWPSGSTQPGTLTLAEDGAEQTTISLAPGCLAFLAPGGTEADCLLAPVTGDIPTSTAEPQAVPGEDEAMSFLCSVGVEELLPVTRASSDPYSTAVLQVALTLLGYDPGPVDGRYGRASKAAVSAFQADAGLTVDARVGPQTWTSIQAAACRVPEDPAQPAD